MTGAPTTSGRLAIAREAGEAPRDSIHRPVRPVTTAMRPPRANPILGAELFGEPAGDRAPIGVLPRKTMP